MWEASSQGLQIHCGNSQQKLWLLEATSEFHKHNNSITHQPGKNTFKNMSVKFAGVVNYMPFYILSKQKEMGNPRNPSKVSQDHPVGGFNPFEKY